MEAGRNVAFVSTNSLQSKLKNYYQYDILLHRVPTFMWGRCTMICSTGLHFLPRQSLLFDIILYFVQPSSLMSSSLPSPMYFHFHLHPSRVMLLSWIFFAILSFLISSSFGRSTIYRQEFSLVSLSSAKRLCIRIDH